MLLVLALRPAFAIAANPSPRVEQVTRVVGEVKGHVLTSREVILSELIEDSLHPERKKELGLSLNQPGFVTLVNRTLDEWVVFSEAQELDLVGPGGRAKADPTAEQSVSPQQVSAALQSAYRQLAANPVWVKIEPAPQEVRATLVRKFTVQRFERLKMDAAEATVTDADAVQYYKKNKARFGNLPFENFKDNIKTMLSRSQTERRLTEWKTILRRKYRSRNYIGTGS